MFTRLISCVQELRRILNKELPLARKPEAPVTSNVLFSRNWTQFGSIVELKNLSEEQLSEVFIENVWTQHYNTCRPRRKEKIVCGLPYEDLTLLI